MFKNTKTVYDIYQYIEEINKLVNDPNKGQLVFRGQGDYGKIVKSSAYRRLEDSKLMYNNKHFQDYHYILINNAIKRCESHPTIKQKEDLLILGELQHFGAATLLIDFTLNSLIALFFACNNEKINGKVYCLNINPSKFSLVNSSTKNSFPDINNKLYDKPVDYFFEDDKLFEIFRKLQKKEQENSTRHFLKWFPPHNNNRIMKQDSIFIINSDGIINETEFDRILIIEKKDKRNLLHELRHKFNICMESIYPDFYGYCIVNSSIMSFKFDENEYLLGIDFYNKRCFEKAIEYFTAEILKNPNNIYSFYYRALSYYQLNEYEKAIEDFNHYLSNDKSDKTLVLFHKAYSQSKLGNYYEAVKDYSNLIELNNKYPLAYNNRGYDYLMIGDFAKAKNDFNSAIRNDDNFITPYLNLSLLNILENKIDEALNTIIEIKNNLLDSSDFVSYYALKAACEDVLRKDNRSTIQLLKSSILKMKIENKKFKFDPEVMSELLENSVNLDINTKKSFQKILDIIKKMQ